MLASNGAFSAFGAWRNALNDGPWAPAAPPSAPPLPLLSLRRASSHRPLPQRRAKPWHFIGSQIKKRKHCSAEATTSCDEFLTCIYQNRNAPKAHDCYFVKRWDSFQLRKRWREPPLPWSSRQLRPLLPAPDCVRLSKLKSFSPGLNFDSECKGAPEVFLRLNMH